MKTNHAVALSIAALFLHTALASAQTKTVPVSQKPDPKELFISAVRPFRIDIPQAALDDLRNRTAATRWPDRETVPDESQGLQLAKVQALVRYWEKDYDWRKVEALLNALPQFTIDIDVIDIHFIHVRSRHPNALPLILTHGWPGSVLEFTRAIGPLTDPTAYGGTAQDAFAIVIPSIPGYGFSGRPKDLGWGPDRVAVRGTRS